MSLDRKPIRVLIIDDDPAYTMQLTSSAAKKQIILKSATNWQQGFDVLKVDNLIRFIILDARCFINETQVAGTESEQFLVTAIDELKEWQRSKGLFIPFCINTGYADSKKMFEHKYRVFSKDDNVDMLLSYVWDEYQKLGIGLFALQYPEPFEFVNEYFTEENKEILSGLFNNNRFLKTGQKDRIDNLGDLRRLYEHFWDLMQIDYLERNINEFPSSDGKRTAKIKEAVNSKITIPRLLSNWADNLYFAASKYGDHNPVDDRLLKLLPTNYTIASFCYGLLDALVWGNHLIKNKTH